MGVWVIVRSVVGSKRHSWVKLYLDVRSPHFSIPVFLSQIDSKEARAKASGIVLPISNW